MKLNEDYTNELREISNGVLLQMEKKNIFRAPEGYFDTLPDNILKKVLLQVAEQPEVQETSLILGSLKNKPTLSVPEGYFNTLPDKILQKALQQSSEFAIAAEQEIQEISPLLASLKNKSTLSAPEGYFDSLSKKLIHKAVEVEEEAVTPVYSISVNKTWIRYAVAAVIAGFIGISAIFLLNTNKQVFIPGETASVKENKNNGGSDFIDVSDGSLANFLSDTPKEKELTLDSTDTSLYDVAFENITENDLAQIIHEISDEDLMSYETDEKVIPRSL